VLRLLARIASRFQHYEFGTATLATCVDAKPGDAALRLDYAQALLRSRKYQEALQQCDEAIKLAPEVLDAYDLRAELLYHLGRYDEAITVYRELAEIPEKRALSLLHLGKVLKTVGESAEATSSYRQSVELEPGMGQAYWELANLKTYRFSDDEVASMRQLLEGDDVGALDKVMIEFALGKALEDAGDYAGSFERYDAANSGYLEVRPFRYNGQNDRFTSFFTADYFATHKNHGVDTAAPIFVVGMPRSGSTLVEQILSSHSLVDATQELDEIVSIARDIGNPPGAAPGQYPERMAELSADDIRGLAQRYLDFAQGFRKDAPYFVDKAPHNFQHIGLIKTLLPNAKIIDIRRNPMASGWSLFRQFFADSYLFSYNLETIGQYYNDYVALMDHWHEVLPGGVLTVRYEDLVGDLRGMTGKILDYCGLAFEEACLDFHLNERAVATPSSEQVRQPLYSDALEHWRNYETFLDPLKQALGENVPRE
jgi:tetratricopeptide (TPR) repeat protein